MRIGEREIGPDQPPYVIAEIGVNHDGSAARALELTRLAATAGAHAVKFQLFEADRLMSKAAKLAAYQKAAGETDPIAMLRRLELNIKQLAPCVDLAHKLGIHAIVSVFSVELVPVAERADWDAYKTASPDIVNKPLLDALAATGRPLIVSTGASTLKEVETALGWLADAHDRLALLQCVSCYPTPNRYAAIKAIRDLQGLWDGPVGYSDHTTGELTGAAAVAEEACILERHMTYDAAAAGPDHGASLEPDAFARYTQHALRAERALRGVPDARRFIKSVEYFHRAYGSMPGSSKVWRKGVLKIEQDVRRVSRQSLVATRDLKAGRRLERADLTIKRPGTGIPPYKLDAVIGRRVVRKIEADMPLMEGDLAR